MENNIDFFKILFIKLPNNELIAYRQISNPSKPILLLIHGQLTTSSWFYEISKELQDSFDLILMDLRGFGRSSYIVPISTIKELSDDVFFFIEQLSLKKINLLGFSLGGAVALQFAADHSDMIDNLYLISSTGISGFPIYDQFNKIVSSLKEMNEHWYFKELVDKLQKKDKKYFENLFFKEFANIKQIQNNHDIHKMFIEEIMLQRNVFETCWASNSFNISNDNNYVNKGNNLVKNITCRTILIHGTRDRAIPFQESKRIYNNISSKEKVLEIVNGADHYAVVNDSKPISELIKKHFK